MKIDNATFFDAAALPLIGPKGENLLTIMVKGTFSFASGRTEPAEDQIPIAYGDEYEDEALGGGVHYESDIAPFKPRADIVLRATAQAPNGKPAPVVSVGIKVGSMEKRLAVFGERYWNHAGVLSRSYAMTAPKPFLRRPIVYRDAFGGLDAITGEYCAENLVGTGLYSPKTKRNLAGKPLPCIEDPRCLIRNLEDRPQPVGFGFYHRAWRPRAAYAGTYDAVWRKQRSPLPPEDFDARFYNGAHPDLQADGYLKAGEPVTLLNLTPEGEVRFNLADVTPACVIQRRTENGKPKSEKPAMRLDTLFMEPDEKRYCLVWRAALPLGDASAAEIDRVSIDIRQG
ncbi:MAG: DUF2169 domain-containing protein [Desulfobacterales bacterium]|nr:DUF2169 domain-containing protein [Desulfobacterales bacterium]